MPPSRSIVAAAALVVLGAVGLAIGLIVGHNNSSPGSIDAASDTDFTPRFDGTLGPTFTLMPSPSPSFSPAPSLRASSQPSGTPTSPPTSLPTPRPTRNPTTSPTPAPTISPAPTPSPTRAPTPYPTAIPVPNDYTFRLKLYWRKGYYWQEDTFEKPWCLECAKCTPLTDSGFGEGCVPKDNGKCERGDQFWLQKCRTNKSGNNARFKIVKRDNRLGDLIQVHNTNLCLERKKSRYMALERCDQSEPRQRWMGFRPNGQPFEWKPFSDGRCVSQHHHPKAREVIYATECDLAHKWDTGLWEAI